MATSAFRSTTRRTSLAPSPTSSSSSSSTTTSSSLHRRSRSVSRFSHRLPAEDPPSGSRKGKFVNTVRGSGVPEISLDDLAIELFSSTDFGARENSLSSTSFNDFASFRRRGRSVSRRGSRISDLRNLSENKNNDENNVEKINGRVFDGSSRRRRSLSVVSRRISDSNEDEHFQKNRSLANPRDFSVWNKLKHSLQKPIASNQQRGLQRSSSQKDFLRAHDGYSSYASTLTDDEGNDTRYNGKGVEKATQAAYAQTKVMADNDGRLDSAHADVLKSVSTMRRSYRTQLEQSEKRKQELLAEIMLVEERGKELKKIVGELRPNSKVAAVSRRSSRGRKRSDDRKRMPKQLVEDADKIIDDFISSFEETDISSFDGERSDTSSVIGGTIKPMMQHGDIEAFKSPLRSDLLPGEMDGVILPWLKWETSNDVTPLLRSDDKQRPTTPKTVLHDTEEITVGAEQDQTVNSKSSRGSWSPGVVNSLPLDVGEISKAEDFASCKSHILSLVSRRSRVDVDDYLKSLSNEKFISERWRQRERINSGGLLVCNGDTLGKFFL